MLTPSAGRLFLCAVPVHQHLKNFHSRTTLHNFSQSAIRGNYIIIIIRQIIKIESNIATVRFKVLDKYVKF